MAAGLGFKDFVTGEVLTAADVDGYLMQGVWVFANAAARSAAVTSPQEGNYSFLKDTNSTEYYDGAAWVAVGGGGASGLTYITGATFTSSTAINVNNCFSATYKNYFIIGSVTASSTDQNLNMRMRVSGADNTTADYDRANMTTNATNLSGGNSLNQSSWTEIITCWGSNTGTNFTIEIFNPFETQYTSARCGMTSFKSNNDILGYIGMTKEQTTSFTGFSLIPTAGNVTGSYRVYGLADA